MIKTLLTRTRSTSNKACVKYNFNYMSTPAACIHTEFDISIHFCVQLKCVQCPKLKIELASSSLVIESVARDWSEGL